MKQQLEEGDVVSALTVRRLNRIRYGQKGIVSKVYVNNQYDIDFGDNRCIYTREELELDIDVQAAKLGTETLQCSESSQGISAPVAEDFTMPILNA